MTRKPVSSRISGNPFADLGMTDPDARLAKAKLALQITAFMREQDLTQEQAAEKLGIDQPQVSRIARGQLKTVSLEKLLTLVNRLNMDIEINVMPNPEPARPAHMVVCSPEDRIAAASDPRNPESIRFD